MEKETLELRDNLSFKNVFIKQDFQDIQKLAVIRNGFVYIDRPNLDELIDFCKKRNYDLNISSEISKLYVKNFTVYIELREDKSYLFKFITKTSPFISNDEKWNQITQPISSKLRFNYLVRHAYQLILAIEYLKELKYYIDYSSDLDWINEENRYHGKSIESFHQFIEPLPHQIEIFNKFFEKKQCGFLLADDPGLGKTISIGMILKRLYDERKIRNVLWIVPTYPLAQQIKEEMYSSFGVDSKIVCGETIMYAREKYDPEKSPYLDSGFIISTWGTFRIDFNDKFDKMKYFNFDAVVFDECHIAKYTLKESKDKTSFWFEATSTLKAVQNCFSKYRFGLTGTPAPNGQWHEIYSVVSSINPFGVKPMSVYIKQYKELINEYEKNPYINNGKEEIPSITSNRIMNKIFIHDFKDTIIRHSRDIIDLKLPKVESMDLIIDFTKEEEEIYEQLYVIFNEILEKQKTSKNKIYNYARMMFWQDIRKYSAYGKKILIRRINAILQSKNQSKQRDKNNMITTINEYLCDNYSDILEEILKNLNNPNVRALPKIEKTLDILSQVRSSRTLLFVGDSIEIAACVANKIHDYDYNTKLIIGSDDMYDNDFKYIYEKLNQGSPSDRENVKILSWFWYPYKDLINLPLKLNDLNIVYEYNGIKTNHIELNNLLCTNKITINIFGNEILKYDEYLSTIIDEVKKEDVDAIINEANNEIKITFSPLKSNVKKVLVCTDKLATGFNLQIAKLVIFYNYPFSPEKYDQKLSRIRRIGSPYSKILMYNLLMGNENGMRYRLKEKFNNISIMDKKLVEKKKKKT